MSNSGTTVNAPYTLTRLNSKLQNTHHHYGELAPGLIHVADGELIFDVSGVVISGKVEKSCSVQQSGNLIAAYDPIVSGFVKF